ncbi:MAG: hypothetical protein VB853_12645 [Pirellulales bacterium]
MNPYYKWFNIPFERQPLDYYRLFGRREFAVKTNVIHSAAGRRVTPNSPVVIDNRTADPGITHPSYKTLHKTLHKTLSGDQHVEHYDTGDKPRPFQH